MSVEVVVVLEESAEPVTTADEPWRESSLVNIDYLRWSKLAAEVSRRAIGRERFRVDIYLHFKGDHLIRRYEYDFVDKLVELAREHTWGGRVFLVLDHSIFTDPDAIRGNIPLIAYWLETARRGRVADVVLISHNRFDPGPPVLGLLKKAGDNSRDRYHDFSELVAPGVWRCWPIPNSAINRFDFEDESPSASNRIPDSNFLIAVDRKPTVTADEKKEIKRFIRKHRDGRFALAVVGIPTDGLAPDLRALAAELRLLVIQFRGWLELRFFLLQLNHLCSSQVVLLPDIIRAVPTNTLPRGGSVDEAPPIMLATSGFNYQEDSVLCREAARDIGKLLHALYPRAGYRIHPALRGGDLPRLWDGVDSLTAWWFIGHGKGPAGLQDVDGQVLRAEEWLDKLSDSGKRPPLVFLSACRSAEVARDFARAGTGVAVGFDSDTLPAPCRILAIQVINAALTSRGDRDAILAAFSAGCRQLQVSGLGHVKPRAFYSVR
jgi:hypothetical protein